MIVVDVETTGLDPEENSILSIGAVDFSSPKNQFYGECRVIEGREINPVALKINGFKEKDIVSKEKSAKELFQEFIQWSKSVKDRTLGGYYVHFDQSFLLNTARTFKLEWPFGIHLVDIYALFYTFMLQKKAVKLEQGVSSYSLDEILVYFGMPPEPNPHNALTGAKITTEVFSKILFGKSVFKEFYK